MKDNIAVNNINKRIKELFNYKKWKLIPHFYWDKELKKGKDILFIWLNPAWYKEDFYNIKTEIPEKKINEIKKQMDNKFLYKPYYKVYEDNFNDDLFNWNYNLIDLFVYRWTKSSELIKEIKKDEEFFKEQYKIFLDLIKLINPKILVVTNWYASRFLKKKFFNDENKNIDYKKWFWEYSFNNRKIPILFTGMLGWQRALDIWTREILKYNIYKILRKLN